MEITPREYAKIGKLLEEIDREVRGKCRGYYIENRTRQMRLVYKKALRREQELLIRREREGQQLSLFN